MSGKKQKRDTLLQRMSNVRTCRKCHKPSSNKLCKTCEKVQGHHDRVEEQRLDDLRKQGWVPPVVETIRNKK